MPHEEQYRNVTWHCKITFRLYRGVSDVESWGIQSVHGGDLLHPPLWQASPVWLINASSASRIYDSFLVRTFKLHSQQILMENHSVLTIVTTFRIPSSDVTCPVAERWWPLPTSPRFPAQPPTPPFRSVSEFDCFWLPPARGPRQSWS